MTHLYFQVMSNHHTLVSVADVEVVMLSCKVSKFNKYNWLQERALIIT